MLCTDYNIITFEPLISPASNIYVSIHSNGVVLQTYVFYSCIIAHHTHQTLLRIIIYYFIFFCVAHKAIISTSSGIKCYSTLNTDDSNVIVNMLL